MRDRKSSFAPIGKIIDKKIILNGKLHYTYTYAFLIRLFKENTSFTTRINGKIVYIYIGQSVTLIRRIADLIFTTDKTFSDSTSISARHNRCAPMLINNHAGLLRHLLQIIIYSSSTLHVLLWLKLWTTIRNGVRYLI